MSTKSSRPALNVNSRVASEQPQHTHADPVVEPAKVVEAPKPVIEAPMVVEAPKAVEAPKVVVEAPASQSYLVVISKPVSFWRCKRKFTHNPTEILLSDLSEADVKALSSEQQLVVKTVVK